MIIPPNLKELIENTISINRDIQIENLLSNNEYKTRNQKFIEECRDHLSTCINKNVFYEWFVDDSCLKDIPTCNCKVHIESDEDFGQFLKVLYSLYRTYSDFNIDEIIKENIINT